MFNLYFVHGWGFEESFWLPVGKILEGKKKGRSINFISLNFFESEKINSITGGNNNIFVTHSYGLNWFLDRKENCYALVNFFAAPNFLKFQKNSEKSKIILDLMIKKLKDSPNEVLNKFYRNCGLSNSLKLGVEKINKDKLVNALKNLRDNSNIEEFLRIKNKTLSIFAVRDKIFDVSIIKLKKFLGSDFDYVLIDSGSHAFPLLEPYKASEIIYNYIIDRSL